MKLNRAVIVATVFLGLGSTTGKASSAGHTLLCGGDRTVGDAVNSLKPGDTLFVSGTCNENLVLAADVNGITLDGQGTAIINGHPSGNTVTVLGRDITIQRFTITGGAHGISVQDTAFAAIDRNTIQNVGKTGIVVFRNSTARITSNVIQNNPGGGINVGHTSSALIGFTGGPGARVSEPNVIQNNVGTGVQVLRGSSAQIFSNTIQNNGAHGVLVDRNSQVEIAACTISGNLQDGVRGMRGAAIDLGADVTGKTRTFDDNPNTGTNGGFGLSCQVGGYVDGHLGTLTGMLGGAQFTSCLDNLAR
jgi:parallel beta-helix repeat protein